MLTNFHWDEAKKNQNGRLRFSTPTILNIFSKKKFFFASFPLKYVKVYWLARIFRNFDDYPGFEPQTAPA